MSCKSYGVVYLNVQRCSQQQLPFIHQCLLGQWKMGLSYSRMPPPIKRQTNWKYIKILYLYLILPCHHAWGNVLFIMMPCQEINIDTLHELSKFLIVFVPYHPNSPLPTTKCRNLKHYWMPRLPPFAASKSWGSLVSLHVEVPQLPWRCVSRRIAAAASRRGPVPRHRPWSNGYHGPPRHRGRAQPSSSFASEIMRNRDTKWEKIDEW